MTRTRLISSGERTAWEPPTRGHTVITIPSQRAIKTKGHLIRCGIDGIMIGPSFFDDRSYGDPTAKNYYIVFKGGCQSSTMQSTPSAELAQNAAVMVRVGKKSPA